MSKLMSKLLLKIAKVIPRLDSESDHERLASLSVIAKLLSQNTDDDGKPSPLKFVDVGIQLTEFVNALGDNDDEPTPAPSFTINPEPEPAPINGFRPAHGASTTQNARASTPTSTPPPSWRPAGQKQRPPKPSGDGWIWDTVLEEWKLTTPPTSLHSWGSLPSHWTWDAHRSKWTLNAQPPQPAGDGWTWSDSTFTWTLTQPPLKPAGAWGALRAHWIWDHYSQTWTLLTPTAPMWHTSASRSTSDYEKRCQLLIDRRAFKNQKEKDFLESCYFKLSNNQTLSSNMLTWFHDISNRIPF